MLLLSDQGSEVRERDREATEVGKEVEEGRKGVAGVISGLMLILVTPITAQMAIKGTEGRPGRMMRKTRMRMKASNKSHNPSRRLYHHSNCTTRDTSKDESKAQ
jgi:hypothetical protein